MSPGRAAAYLALHYRVVIKTPLGPPAACLLQSARWPVALAAGGILGRKSHSHLSRLYYGANEPSLARQLVWEMAWRCPLDGVCTSRLNLDGENTQSHGLWCLRYDVAVVLCLVTQTVIS